MKMNTTCATIALTLGLAAASQAAIVLANGDFSAGSNWKSQDSQSPDSWTASIQGTDSSYGESITGYGSGRLVGLKDVTGAYVQQSIGLVGDTTGLQIDFLAGHRSHSTYTQAVEGVTAITVKVSLWDATLNTELASTTIDYLYTSAAAALVPESEILNYVSANSGNDLALRFENVSNEGINFNHATLLVDSISITPVPEPSSAALLGLGGIALILRRRK